MKIRTKEEFVQAILADYEKGTENAYEAYKNAYGATHQQTADEDDIAYIKRCAEQDYADAEQGAALYQDYYEVAA